MLKPITELLTGPELMSIGMAADYSAMCLDTGAYLIRSNGRTRSGIPNWTLILPDNVPATRLDFFLRRGSWTHRSQFKAPDLATATRIGNERLPKLLAKQRGRNETQTQI